MKKLLVRLISGINPLSKREEENRVLYSIRILLSAYIVYFIGLIVAEGVIILGSMPFGYNATDRQLPQDILLICSFFGYAFLILLIILFAVKVNKVRLKDIGIDKHVAHIFKGIVLGLVSLGLIMVILLGCGFVRFDGINHNINRVYFVLFFFAFLVQGSMEEVICRGYLFHRLKDKDGAVVSAVLSILFFSLFHFSKLFEEGVLIGIFGVINLILISVIFTLLTWYDKNIFSAIGFHWTWNFTLFNVIGLNLSGIEGTDSLLQMSVTNEFFTGGGYGIESSVMSTGVLTLILSMILLMEKGKVKNNGVQ